MRQQADESGEMGVLGEGLPPTSTSACSNEGFITRSNPTADYTLDIGGGWREDSHTIAC